MTGQVSSAGCVIILLDESAAMESPVQEDQDQSLGQQPKPKSEALGTAVNALLKQLGAGPDFELALVGYRTNAAGDAVVESRWGGSLAGRTFVPVSEFKSSPATIEQRVRRTPNPNGIGQREENVEFPIWYVPTLSGKAPQIKAFEYCQQLLEQWAATAGPSPGAPLIVHVFAGGSGDGNPQRVIEGLQKLSVNGSTPLIVQAHMSAAKVVPPTLYPASRAYLPAGPTRDLFERCSILPAPLAAALKNLKLTINPNARGMLYNAKMIDIVKFLSIAKLHTKDWPSRVTAPPAPAPTPSIPISSAPEPVSAPPEPVAEAPLPPLDEPAPISIPLSDSSAPAELTEKRALVVFLLDRSVNDPFSGDMKNPCARLQEATNDLLAKLGKKGEGQFDAALVSYGMNSYQEEEVRSGFEGPLTGQTTVADTDLLAGAIRVDEVEEQMPNGIGGIMNVTVKKHIFVEVDPTSGGSPVPAFTAVRDLVSEWTGRHPSACVPPVVLHLTRGVSDPARLAESAGLLSGISPAAGPVVLYHLVATETPHKSASYPNVEQELETPELKSHWELSSPLLGREQLSATKTFLTPDSRGFVVNGKFDLLLDGIKQVLAR